MTSRFTPRVSVLMPVRNGAPELPLAIDSLVKQEFEEFEVVAIDDGSTDNTPEILNNWKISDSRIRVLTTHRRGIARALDVGLRATRAPLVARMDSDDIALPQRLAQQVRTFERDPNLHVLGTHIELFPRGEELRSGMRRYEKWLNSLKSHDEIIRDLFVESPLCHPSVMARRSALIGIGGYRDVDGPEDYDLWLRLAQVGARFRNLPRVLLRWRHRPERATLRDRRYRQEAIFKLKLWHLLRWRVNRGETLSIWGAGPLGKKWARYLLRRHVNVRSFIDIDPQKIGQRIYGIPVYGLETLPDPGAALILAAVGAEGVRELIRNELLHLGYEEGLHFLCLQ